jgi:type II secretion system protein N
LNTKTKYGIYVLCGLVALLSSLYVRFPADTVRIYAARQMEAILPGLHVAVATVRPSFPAAVQLEGIEAQFQNRPVLAVDQARMSPAWGELVRLTPAWRVAAAIGGGRLRALIRTPAKASPGAPTLQADLDRIDLSKLEGLQGLFGRRIAGLCSGTVIQTRKEGKYTSTIRLQLSGAVVELKQPILQRGQVLLHTVEVEADLFGDVLQIRRLTFQGDEFDGRLAGAIDFKNDAAGALALEGALKPHAALLAQLKRAVPDSSTAQRGKSGELEFQLSGSIKNPRYSFR